MRFAIKDAANIVVINKVTGQPIFYSEDANSFEFKMSSEAVYAKAKGNKAIAFEGEVTCELKMDFEVIQFAQLSLILASDVVDKTGHPVAQFQKVSVASKKATLKNIKPVEGSLIAFKLESDGQEHGDKLEFTSEVVSDDTVLTITSPINDNDLIIVYYTEKKARVKTVTMKAEGKSTNLRIEADVHGKTSEGENMALHLSVKNAKPKRNAELTFSAENPSKFPIELDCFPDENGEYAELTYIGASTEASMRKLAEKFGPETVFKKEK